VRSKCRTIFIFERRILSELAPNKPVVLIGNPVREVDYLIVGQGLAGSVLACLFQMARIKVLVIDNAHRTAASIAAAGIINPITGTRLNRPFLIDQLLANAFAIYPSIEEFLGTSFFQRRIVLRLLQSAEEQHHWIKRVLTGDYARYLGSVECPRFLSDCPWFGGFEIAMAGQVDIPTFVRHTRNALAASDSLAECEFEFGEMRLSDVSVQWRQYTAKAVIFCEGYKLTENPFFKPIQLNPAKGECLTLRAPEFTDDRIIQRGKWLFRTSLGEVKAGTTYTWDRLDESPTQAGRDEIETAIRGFADFNFEVTAHSAGVRPVIRVDNRPVLGTHPDNRRVAIFNGLGSKGALQAPFASKQLIDNLEQGLMIHPEFDVCRKSLWQQRRSA
jgi:glycine/D-amino acid oxidase-like deaminating enzyme